jgi:hypothetical protein
MLINPGMANDLADAIKRYERIKEIKKLMREMDSTIKEDQRDFTFEEKRDWQLLTVELEVLQRERSRDPISKSAPRPEYSYIVRKI